jgi:hypothetical protein
MYIRSTTGHAAIALLLLGSQVSSLDYDEISLLAGIPWWWFLVRRMPGFYRGSGVDKLERNHLAINDN